VSSALPAVLAIDGGNSKTDIALVGADGTLLAGGRGPGVRTFPTPEVLAAIGAVIGAAALDAGLPGGWPVAAHTVACMANADLPEEEERLAAMIGAAGWSTTTEVANDTFAVLRAGLDTPRGRPWGVGVTCGAGINCAGVGPDGRTTGFLALGGITGDWGGAYGLGRAALWWAIRAEDGRGPQTALREAVPAYFGLKDPLDVAEALHLGEISWDRIASLAPIVLRVADAGDEVARGLVLRLAQEIFLLVKSAVTRLGLTAEPVPVVLGGGVVASGNSLLIEHTTGLITATFPAADVRVLRQVPVAGAALLGLDLAVASLEAKHRLRGAFSNRSAAGA